MTSAAATERDRADQDILVLRGTKIYPGVADPTKMEWALGDWANGLLSRAGGHIKAA